MPESLDELKQQLSEAFHHDHSATSIALAERILRETPDDSMTLSMLGNSLAAVSRFSEAESALLAALEQFPENRRSIAMSDLGHVCHLRGDHENAIAWYRKTIDANPRDASGYIYLGSTLARAGDLLEAEQSHRLATQCSKGCIDEAWHNLGLVMRAQGKLLESKRCFEMAISIDAKYTEAEHALIDVNTALRLHESTE